jgi:hypothetical protein
MSSNKNDEHIENEEKLVNGPVNAFRLEGKINNINKAFYFFGDYHFPIYQETKCDSFLSKDWVSYFISTMKTTDNKTKYDFLYENFADTDMFDQYLYSNYTYREKYLNEIRKYIDKDMIIYEKKKNNNTIEYENKGSKRFPNLRLHYLDIRSFYGYKDFFIFDNVVSDSFDSFEKNYTIEPLNKLINEFNYIKIHLMFLHNNILKNTKISKEKKYEIEKEIIEKDNKIKENIKNYYDFLVKSENRMDKYSEKIFKKYENNDVKNKILNSELIDAIFKNIKKTLKNINYCIIKIEKLKILASIDPLAFNKKTLIYDYGKDTYKIAKIFCKIKNKYHLVNEYQKNTFTYLTDLYLLRRILDKNFISNGIIYTGMAHTSDYIYILIKEFGFNLTHAGYTKLSIEQTNNAIKKLSNINEIDPYIYKPVFKQCTNMNKFPEKFE